MDDDVRKISCFFIINYKTDRFHVVVHCFSIGSQRKSKCGK